MVSPANNFQGKAPDPKKPNKQDHPPQKPSDPKLKKLAESSFDNLNSSLMNSAGVPNDNFQARNLDSTNVPNEIEPFVNAFSGPIVPSKDFDAYLQSITNPPKQKAPTPEPSYEVSEELVQGISPVEFKIFEHMIKAKNPNQNEIEACAHHLKKLLKRMPDYTPEIMELMLQLAKKNESTLLKVIDRLPIQHVSLFYELLLPPSFSRAVLGLMQKEKQGIVDLKTKLTHLGYEPSPEEAEKQVESFALLPVRLQLQLIKNLEAFLVEFKGLQSSFTPLDMIKLSWLQENIKTIKDHYKESYEKITAHIIECQTKILDSQSKENKQLFARLINDWDLMGDLRDRAFPSLFSQIEPGNPVINKPMYQNKHWFTYQEQLNYLMDRAASMKLEQSENATHLDHIIARAKTRLHDLENGIDVRMPFYYHGTHKVETVKAILDSSILALEALYGKGAYISTAMEPDYGPFYFALDRRGLDKLELSKASTVNSQQHSAQGSEASWRATKGDIPLKQDKKIVNLAYLVLPDKQDAKLENDLALFLKSIDPHQLFEIISFSEAKLEHHILEELRGRYEPKHWSKEWESALKEQSTINTKFLQKEEESIDNTPDDEWS